MSGLDYSLENSSWEHKPEYEMAHSDLKKEIKMMQANDNRLEIVLSKLVKATPKGKFRVILLSEEGYEIIADCKNIKKAKKHIPKSEFSTIYLIYNDKFKKVYEQVFECPGGAIS